MPFPAPPPSPSSCLSVGESQNDQPTQNKSGEKNHLKKRKEASKQNMWQNLVFIKNKKKLDGIVLSRTQLTSPTPFCYISHTDRHNAKRQTYSY